MLVGDEHLPEIRHLVRLVELVNDAFDAGQTTPVYEPRDKKEAYECES